MACRDTDHLLENIFGKFQIAIEDVDATIIEDHDELV